MKLITSKVTPSAGNYGRLAHIDNLEITEIAEVGESCRFGFGGYEKDNEVSGEGNSIDFGERMYDGRLGRFKSIDRYFKKYPFFSPYQFAGNSPILIMDNNGDSLRVSGGATEITKFIPLLSATFADKIKIKVNEKGYVTMTGDPSKLSANDKALYNSLNTIISNKKTTDVYLVNESERKLTKVGIWQQATVNGKKVNSIDVYDTEKFAGQPVWPEGLIIHEIWETYQNQVLGKGYDDAHKSALGVQGAVDGTTLGSQWHDQGIETSGTGKAYSLITRKGKLHTVIWDVSNNDVNNVSSQEGWIVPSIDGKGTTTLKTGDDIKKYQEAAAKNKPAPAKKGG